MQQTNYLKIVWIVAFLAFAAVSCWATAESLHMLLSSWPTAMCWIVTVGFFIIASLGTKMIVDSLNQNVYCEKRGLRLVGGVVIVLVFWLICSMPTNTHTFFYRTIIGDKVTTDISTTRGYLGQIKNNTNNKKQAEIQIKKLRNDIDVALGQLKAEIENANNPGFGPNAKRILDDIATLLGVAQIKPLSIKTQNPSIQERSKLYNDYRSEIYTLRDSREDNIRAHILSPNQDALKEVKGIDENLSLMKKYINDGTIDLNNPRDVTGADGVCDKLNEGYNAIKKNKDFVNFYSETDEANYTAGNPVTKVRRMISVFNVWEDYIKGEFAGFGFIYWIILSVLVDIAAFVFFDLAFRKTDD